MTNRESRGRGSRSARRAAAALAPALILASCAGPAEGPPAPPTRNIVLIVVDTLRQDHNGCYGFPRETTPHLDALAATGTTFANAYTVSPWTLPSMASLFTGLYPSRHGVTAFDAKLPAEARSLAEILREEGFVTGGVVSNVLLNRKHGFDEGFRFFDESMARGDRNISTPRVTGLATDLLRRMVGDGRRFFLYVHYFDPHFAYHRHPEYGYSSDGAGRLRGGERIEKIRHLDDVTPEELAFLIDCYDEEIRWTDEGVGAVLETLRRLEVDGETLVVFAADHGEEFLSRGWIGHTRSLFNELMRVPLVIRDPRFGPRIEPRPVSVVGILPTVLELIGVAQPETDLQGKSFAGGVTGGPAGWNEEVFMEVDFEPGATRNEKKRVALRCLLDGPWKIIKDRATDTFQLFDLSTDPQERTDVLSAQEELGREMARRLNDLSDRAASGPLREETIPVSEDERERLRGLGYVGD